MSMFHQRRKRTDIQTPLDEQKVRVVVAGDIHGDLLALVHVLQMSDCFELANKNTWQDWREYLCEHSAPGSTNLNVQYILSRWVKNLKWSVPATEIILLGDILDGKRPDTKRPPIGALPTGSEELIVATLLHLRANSDHTQTITWVLGNHDIWNITNKGWCSLYSNACYCNKKRPQEYTAERVKWAQKAATNLDAVGLAVRHGVAFCHGGICTDFLNQFEEETSGEQLVDAINKLYKKTVEEGQRPDKLIQKKNPITRPPDWCRHGCVTNIDEKTNSQPCLRDSQVDTPALVRIGCHAMVVGHSVARKKRGDVPLPHVRHTRQDGTTTIHELEGGESVAVEEYQQFFVDTAMSRAFGFDPVPDNQDQQKTYACLILSGQVLSQHRPNKQARGADHRTTSPSAAASQGVRWTALSVTSVQQFSPPIKEESSDTEDIAQYFNDEEEEEEEEEKEDSVASMHTFPEWQIETENER